MVPVLKHILAGNLPASCELAFTGVSKFLVADDYRLDPSHIPPYSKSDDEANEKAGAQIHEHLLSFLIIGIETGSIKDNSKIDFF